MTVYFDNAATTFVCKEAADKVYSIMTEGYGNPSSTHGKGRCAKNDLTLAREKVAKAIGAKPEEIFFTSGGTEADNWAIFSGAELNKHKGHHIISSSAEHDAIRKPLLKLQSQGWDVTFLTPDSHGRITPRTLEEALREDTVLVSLMLVNNETGAVNPISEYAKILKKRRSQALLHTDAVQGFCKVPFTVQNLGADLITLSSHKIHGPKGVGALYIKNGMRFPPHITGGGQEKEYRSGTENMPGICGFGEAAALGHKLLSDSIAHMRSLRELTMSLLAEKLPDIVFIGDGDAPHVLSLSLPGYRSEVLLNYLDSMGIFVSKSSACKRGARSHVLEALGLPPKVIDGAIRVSFSRYNTEDEVRYFVDSLVEASGKLRKGK